MQAEQTVIARRDGRVGRMVLNRPQALNAVDLPMIRACANALKEWRDDPRVHAVVLEGAGDRAFCAGGDVRALRQFELDGEHHRAETFFREEYALNLAIATYSKPYIALIDGICMGGGIGVSVHAPYRVATERAAFAMPETAIGFFPDIGATFFLPRLPGELGGYCALTGERLNADDGVAATIATHRVASSRFADLIDALCNAVPVEATLAAFAEPAGPGKLAPHRGTIDRLFTGARVEDILAALDSEARRGTDAAFAAATAATIRTKSPTALKLALAQMRTGATLSFQACMQTEFRIVSRVIHGHDFYEGVRAVIVDKDNAPRWKPAALADAAEADVERHFASLGADELVLP